MDWATLDWEKIANAIVILVVGLAAGLGLRSGQGDKKRSGAPAGSVEIAGALVDSSSVKALDGTVKALTSSIDDGVEENLNYRKSLERGVEDLVDGMKDVEHALNSLTNEIIRSKRT